MHLGIRHILTTPSRRPRIVTQLVAVSAVMPLALVSLSAHAQERFALDFSGTTSTTVAHGNGFITNQTPFFIERIVDPATRTTYDHLIIGDPTTGFAQEVYIARTPSRVFQGGPSTASGGAGENPRGGNGTNPLAISDQVNSGNASGTPTRVVMRQLVTDGEMTMDFVKGELAQKPKVTQDIETEEMVSQFEVDMSAISYDDLDTSAQVTNTLTIIDPNAPPPTGSAQFNMATDVQASTVSGGRYIYTPGSGYLGSEGTYTYWEGTYDATQQDLENLFDMEEANPWSYNQNRPQ